MLVFSHEIWIPRKVRKSAILTFCLLILSLVLPLSSQSEDAYGADEEAQGFGSRTYWMLNPSKYAKLNREGKARLEACVARMHLVSEVRLRPTDDGHIVEIEVVNRLNSPITGLVVEPHDNRLKALDLDGRTVITFEPIQPSERYFYRQSVTDLTGVFPTETSFELTAYDVIDERGLEVVEYIYWSHWPLVSSHADLIAAQRALCGSAADELNPE